MPLLRASFDLVSLLNSEEAISEYLAQVLAEDDKDEYIRALKHVTEARSRPTPPPPR